MLIQLLSFSQLDVSDKRKHVYLNNHLSQPIPTLKSTNSNEPLYYPFIVSINKCGGSCNTIDNSDD